MTYIILMKALFKGLLYLCLIWLYHNFTVLITLCCCSFKYSVSSIRVELSHMRYGFSVLLLRILRTWKSQESRYDYTTQKMSCCEMKKGNIKIIGELSRTKSSSLPIFARLASWEWILHFKILQNLWTEHR